MIDHWISKGRFSRTSVDNIDWDGQLRAIKSSTLGRRRFVKKWANEWLATGTNMERWGLRHHGYCPFCEEPKETTLHILTCNDTEAEELWKQSLWTFIEGLGKVGTCTRALLAIKWELTYWRLSHPPPDITNLSPNLQRAIRSQREVGCKSFFEGLYSKDWGIYQRQHFHEKNSRKGHRLWVSKAIRLGWDLLISMWTGRNQQLHNTARIEAMEGKQEIIDAIESELDIGLSGLAAYEFSYLFRPKLEELVSKTLESMREWLSILKQGRITHRDRNRVIDNFAREGALKRSLGLIEYTEKELEEIEE